MTLLPQWSLSTVTQSRKWVWPDSQVKRCKLYIEVVDSPANVVYKYMIRTERL